MPKRETKLILGSASPFRKKILEDAGFAFDIKVSNLDEKKIREKDFRRLVLKLALAKKDAILDKYNLNPDSIVITLDTIATHNGKLREKPVSPKEVIAWHKEYSEGRTKVYCSIVAHHVGMDKTLKAVDVSSISWRKIPDRAIAQIARNPLTYKAAAFNSRSFFHYAKNVKGSIDSVLGAPVRILEEFLEKLGYYR